MEASAAGITCQLRNHLKAANIGFLSVQPVYEWKPKQKVIGYRCVTTDVTLKLKRIYEGRSDQRSSWPR